MVSSLLRRFNAADCRSLVCSTTLATSSSMFSTVVLSPSPIDALLQLFILRFFGFSLIEIESNSIPLNPPIAQSQLNYNIKCSEIERARPRRSWGCGDISFILLPEYLSLRQLPSQSNLASHLSCVPQTLNGPQNSAQRSNHTHMHTHTHALRHAVNVMLMPKRSFFSSTTKLNSALALLL